MWWENRRTNEKEEKAEGIKRFFTYNLIKLQRNWMKIKNSGKKKMIPR